MSWEAAFWECTLKFLLFFVERHFC
ncbi:hypothetical protein EMIT0P44_20123 [Pseudomonas sp. IT-P44]